MKASKGVQWGSIELSSLDHLSLLDRVFVFTALAGIMTLSFPHLSLAQSVQQPFVFEIKNSANLKISLFDLDEPFHGEDLKHSAPEKQSTPEVIEPIIILDPRVSDLREYLQNKKSPLADYSQILLKQYHYRLILGISFAESNFCKVQIKPHNCWGIGGSYPERYDNYGLGIVRANNLIQKYFENGMKNPKLMRDTWVGWENHSWPVAVEQVTKELESRGL